jgi:hypothetical protein
MGVAWHLNTSLDENNLTTAGITVSSHSQPNGALKINSMSCRYNLYSTLHGHVIPLYSSVDNIAPILSAEVNNAAKHDKPVPNSSADINDGKILYLHVCTGNSCTRAANPVKN